MPAEKLLRFLGRDRPGGDVVSTESTIQTDEALTDVQKQSLLDVYRAFIAANDLLSASELAGRRHHDGDCVRLCCSDCCGIWHFLLGAVDEDAGDASGAPT